MPKLELPDGSRWEVDKKFFDLPPREQQRLLHQLADSERLDVNALTHPFGDQEASGTATESTQNPFQAATQTSLDLVASIPELGEKVGDVFATQSALDRARSGDLSGIREGNPFDQQGVLGRTADTLRGLAGDREFQSAVSFDDVKADPLNLPQTLRFAADNAIVGLPEAAATLNPIGLGLVGGETGADIAEERRRRSGKTPDRIERLEDIPTLGDQILKTATDLDTLIGAGAGAGTALLQRFGFKGALGDTAETAGQLALQAARAGGVEAGTGAAQGLALEVASGLGTDEGVSREALLNSAASEALTGFVGGAAGKTALGAPEVASRTAEIGTLGREAAANNAQLLAEESAFRRLEQARESRKDATGRLKDTRDDTSIARGEADRLTQNARSLVDALETSGQLNEDTATGLRRTVNRAKNQQRRLDQTDLDLVANSGLDDGTQQTIAHTLREIDALKRAGVARNAKTGPVERAAVPAGRVLGGGLGFKAGGFVGGAIGQELGARAGQTVGRLADSAAGTTRPDIVRQAKTRARVLKRRGFENTDQPSTALDTVLSDVANQANTETAQTAQLEARARAAARRNRHMIREADPEGLHAPSHPFDRKVLEDTGYGPAAQDRLLADLMRTGDLTQGDLDAFYNDPTALLEGFRGPAIIDLMKIRGGELGLQPSANAAPTSARVAVRNEASNAETIAVASEARQLAQRAAPDRQAEALVLDIANARTRAEKIRLIDDAVRARPELEGFAEAYLRRLANFGPN